MAESASVARVRAALLAAGHADTIAAFPEGTRTASEAAAAIGCTVAQIAKSIVFRAQDGVVLVVASGANRVAVAKVAALLGTTIKRAEGEWVRAQTGFAIGGVSPIGHLARPRIVLDRDLLALDPIWAAAGTPSHVFRTTPADLVRLTNGTVADVAEDAAG